MTHAIVWFRKGLRLHDNPALLAACEGARRLYPVFVLDPWFVNPERVGLNRMRFLLESLQDLDRSLRALSSRLLVVRGKPVEVLPGLWRQWQINRLTFERDTEPYALTRDGQVHDLAQPAGVEVIVCTSHTLYDPDQLIKANRGRAPQTYQSFCKLVARLGPPLETVASPASLPSLAEVTEAQYPIPSLSELGYPAQPEAEPSLYQGGEHEGLRRLASYLSDPARVASFSKPDTDPTAFEPPATTALGPYLKFGCISVRTFYTQLQAVYAQLKSHTQPPVSLLGQLYWREFFYTLAYVTPNYDQMVGNPLCRQIAWDDNEPALRAWAEARTGYPWIDAAMTQLRREGWLHHLSRHAVACFLTRGDLWLSWEKGQAVFNQLLIDADWSINASNWMWLSASAFFHAYHRVYSPITFAKGYDPEGHYIRHYLPVLKQFPKQYIYEPWKAPLAVQQQADCLIGQDYPRPIVAHIEAKERNLGRMRAAYAVAP